MRKLNQEKRQTQGTRKDRMAEIKWSEWGQERGVGWGGRVGLSKSYRALRIIVRSMDSGLGSEHFKKWLAIK